MKKIALTFSLCSPLLMGGGAFAQAVGTKAQVVTACGQSTFSQYINGQQNYVPFTILPNGLLCVVTPSTGSGAVADQTGDSSKSAAPSATNQHTLSFGYAFDPASSTWLQVYVDPATHAVLERTVGPSMNAPGVNGTVARTIQGVDGGKAVAVSGTFYQATQPVSGTVTANQGAAPWAVSWTGQSVGITGTVKVDGSAVTQPVSGTVSVGNFPATQPVSGTVTATQANGAVYAVSWTGQTVAATQSGAYTVTQGPAGATAWKVDGSGVTQPVSGTVTANQGGAPWSTTDTNAATSITAPGTAASKAQAVQGVAGATPVPTSVASLPLPAGASTSANQTSEIAGIGAPADAAAGTGNGSIVAQLKQLHIDAIAPTPVGSNVIGKVGIDQTTPGSTNRVSLGTDNIAVTPSNAATAATAANQTSEIAAFLRTTTYAEFNAVATTANGNSVGSIRPTGSTASKLNVGIVSTQSGTVLIQECDNSSCSGITFNVGSLAVSTSTATGGFSNATTLSGTPIILPFYRIVFVNGATAGTLYGYSSSSAN